MGVQMTGPLKYVRARTPAGKLTNFKTGDRFVDIVIPVDPLPKKKSMGVFTASLYHKEQKQSQSEIECGNCREKGHTRRNCENETVCYACNRAGHKKGDLMCPALSRPPSIGVVLPDQEQNITDDEETTLSEQDQRSDNESLSEDDECEDVDDDERVKEDDDQEKVSKEDNKVKDTNTRSDQGENEGKEGEKVKDANKRQALLSTLWSAAAQGTPTTARSNSPARARKVGERSPEEQELNSKTNKKQKTKNKNGKKKQDKT